MKYIILLVLLLSPVCYATVYQQQNPNGGLVFSDTPLKGATEVSLPNSGKENETPTTPPPLPQKMTQTTAQTAGVTDTTKQAYTTFVILSPHNQETFQNQPSIPVAFGINPALQKGDKIEVYLDGKLLQTVSGNQVDIDRTLVDRGTHEIHAVLYDANAKILKTSNSVTIFVHYTGLNSPASPLRK